MGDGVVANKITRYDEVLVCGVVADANLAQNTWRKSPGELPTLQKDRSKNPFLPKYTKAVVLKLFLTYPSETGKHTPQPTIIISH